MKWEQIELQTNKKVRSLVWEGDLLVDWVDGGTKYSLDGKIIQGKQSFSEGLNAAQVSPSGRYVALYERLGTKGVLLCEGKAIRKLTRSEYHAQAYEYPLCFFELDGKEFLVHCPDEYCQLEIQCLKTGNKQVSHVSREPSDFFHARLRVDPSFQYLMSAGWIWHPFDFVACFDLRKVLEQPHLFDSSQFEPDTSNEISCAVFLGNHRLAVWNHGDGFDDEGEGQFPFYSLGVWNLKAGSWESVVQPEMLVGEMMPLGANHVIGFYEFPKLIELSTGKVLASWPEIESGVQASSIMGHVSLPPPIAWEYSQPRFAVAGKDSISVISFLN